MIEVKNLSKSFGAVKAIDAISAHIEEGHVFGLIGTNGAGKSTLMRLLTGVLKPDGGEILIDGEPVYDNPAVKEKIVANTRGLCTEMEGAAIAQTAYRNSVPFVILRAISDKADDSAEMDYPTFEKIAAHRCAEVTCKLAKHLHEAEMMN